MPDNNLLESIQWKNLQNKNPKTKEFMGLLTGFIPGVSDVQSGLLAAQDVKNQKYAQALLDSVGMLPFVPALGGMIKNAPKTKIIDYGNGLVDILHDGEKVGALKYQIKDNMAQITRADVIPEFQNKGIGTEAHKQFINNMFEKGLDVGSDSMLTKNSVKIFDKLKNMGYNVEQSPEATFVEKYLIPTTKENPNWERLNTTTREFRLNKAQENPNLDINELASGGIPAFIVRR